VFLYSRSIYKIKKPPVAFISKPLYYKRFVGFRFERRSRVVPVRAYFIDYVFYTIIVVASISADLFTRYLSNSAVRARRNLARANANGAERGGHLLSRRRLRVGSKTGTYLYVILCLG